MECHHYLTIPVQSFSNAGTIKYVIYNNSNNNDNNNNNNKINYVNIANYFLRMLPAILA